MSVFLKWFPPSWLLINAQKLIIYIDPAYLRTYYTHYPHKIEFSRWPDPIDGLPENLPAADLILISHAHKDHAKDITIKRLTRKTTRVVGPGRCAKNLANAIQVVKPGEVFSFKGLQIHVVDAYNTPTGHSTRKVHHKGDGVGYVIAAEGKRIYHAGDTDVIPEMKKLGPLDVALLPIGGTFTMDIADAVQAASQLRPAVVIPIHHAKADPQEFKQSVEARTNIKAVVLKIGETYRLA